MQMVGYSTVCRPICWDINRLGGTTSLQPVLVEASGLHDDRKVSALLLQQLEVLERVAVDDNQVGKGALLQTADLALHACDLGADRGSRADDLRRRQYLCAQCELLRLRYL